MKEEPVTSTLQCFSREVSQKVDRLCGSLAILLTRCDPSARDKLLTSFTETMVRLLDQLNATALAALGGDPADAGPEVKSPIEQETTKLPAPVLEWARKQFNEEEFVEGLREIRAIGGLKLSDFIPELENEAGA